MDEDETDLDWIKMEDDVELEEGGGKRERREGQGRRGVYVGGG